MNKRNEDPSNKKPILVELLSGEIIYTASHAVQGLAFDQVNDPKAFIAATDKLRATRKCLDNYLTEIERKKAELERIKISDEDTIEAQDSLQKEISELDALIVEVDQHLLPAAQAATEEIRTKIDKSLQAAIQKVKEKYEVQLNQLFSEATDLVFSLTYGRPAAGKLN